MAESIEQPPGAGPGSPSGRRFGFGSLLLVAATAAVVGALAGFAVGSSEEPRLGSDIRVVAFVGGPTTSVGEDLLPVITVNAGAEPFRVEDVRLADDSDVPWRLLPPDATVVAPGEVADLLVRFEQDCARPSERSSAVGSTVVEVQVESGGQRRTETVDVPASLVGVITGTVGRC